MRSFLPMRSPTKASTSLTKSPTIIAGDADPWPPTRRRQMKQSTSVWTAWGRSSTWSCGRPQTAWLHLASPSRSWERMAPRAWGPTRSMTSAFTRGRWGRRLTPRWHCPHAQGWWVWTCTELSCFYDRFNFAARLLVSEMQMWLTKAR